MKHYHTPIGNTLEIGEPLIVKGRDGEIHGHVASLERSSAGDVAAVVLATTEGDFAVVDLTDEYVTVH